MKRLTMALILMLVFAVQSVSASAADARFDQIKIFDDILVYVDVDGDAVAPAELKAYAVESFKKHMRGMEINNDAVVDNYPAKGYTLGNVGYIMLKLMSIQTKSGVSAYHLDFEFGIPPRSVYWDSADMGIAPTFVDLKKEAFEDVDGLMERFAKDFYKKRGE